MFLKLKRRKRQGGFSTVIVASFVIAIMMVSFYYNMNININSIKYENMSQYARDALLKMETDGVVQKTYLVGVKSDVQSKLNMKNGETFNAYVKIGDGTKYNVNNMPNTITADLGEDMEIELVYKYTDTFISNMTDKFKFSTYTENKVMRVDLHSTSKNRRTSDG